MKSGDSTSTAQKILKYHSRDIWALAWIVLGATFAAFTLLIGFSFWQGSRLHFPAEMAWSFLLAYLLVVSQRKLATWWILCSLRT